MLGGAGPAPPSVTRARGADLLVALMTCVKTVLTVWSRGASPGWLIPVSPAVCEGGVKGEV